MPFDLIKGILGDLDYNDNDRRWPPKIGSTIIVRVPNYREYFIGKVLDHLWSKTAITIRLINHIDYVDPTLKLNNIADKGVLLVLPTFGWRYVDRILLQTLLAAESPDKINTINTNIEHGYQKLLRIIEIEQQKRLK
jgi:hypothetical protein